jgi:hypothetical protein
MDHQDFAPQSDFLELLGIVRNSKIRLITGLRMSRRSTGLPSDDRVPLAKGAHPDR